MSGCILIIQRISCAMGSVGNWQVKPRYLAVSCTTCMHYTGFSFPSDYSHAIDASHKKGHLLYVRIIPIEPTYIQLSYLASVSTELSLPFHHTPLLLCPPPASWVSGAFQVLPPSPGLFCRWSGVPSYTAAPPSERHGH